MEAPAPVSLASVAVADSHLPCSDSLSPPWLALAVEAWAAVPLLDVAGAPVGTGLECHRWGGRTGTHCLLTATPPPCLWALGRPVCDASARAVCPCPLGRLPVSC